MMASACSNFRPNLWRPSTCANCYRHKSKHAKISSEEKSPEAAKTKAKSELQKIMQRMAEVDGKQIGIVKPYAIVDIPNERRFSEPGVVPCRVPLPNGAARSNPGEKVRSSSVSSNPSEKVRSSSVSSNPGEKVCSSSVSSNPSEKVRSSSVSSNPSEKVRSSSVSSNPGEKVCSSSVPSNPSEKVHSSSVSSNPSEKVRSSSVSSNLSEKVRSSSVSSFGRRPLTPKRKAPPPPPPPRSRSEKLRTNPSPKLDKPRKTPSPHPLRRNTVSSQSKSSTVPPLQRNRATTHLGPPRMQVQSSQHSPSHSSTVQRSRFTTVPEEQPDQKEKANNLPQEQAHEKEKPEAIILQERPHQKQKAASTTSHEQPHQRKRAASVSPESLDGLPQPQRRERATTVARSDNIPPQTKPKKIPPQKPPRTLSTFISIEDQEALLQQLLFAGTSTTATNHPTVQLQQPSVPQLNGLCHSPDIEPPSHCHEHSGSSVSCGDTISRERSVSTTSTSSATSPTSPVFVSTGQLHSQMIHLMEATLRSVYENCTSQLWCKESMWGMQWQDLEVLSSKTVGYKGIPFTIECSTEDMEEGIQHEVKLSQLLSPHMNISLVRTILNTTPNDVLPKASKYFVRDCIDGGLLSELLCEKRKSVSPEAFVNIVLLCLIQVFGAVAHLHDLGLCHRDIGLDCLHVAEYGSEWIVRLSNFHYALHRPGPVNGTSFTYGYNELKWLGGADSRLPPEVMNTPEDMQTLDYSHTDCFAAGCLIYEMMGHDNPFERDSQLVYQQYTSDDLPCTLPPTLQRLADMLLCRDPSRRLGAPMALLIAQALLWLPPDWAKENVSETVIRHHLSYEKALLVSTLATTNLRPLPLSLVMKAHFFSTCDSFELNRTLSLFC